MMSVAIAFITQAADAIGRLSPADSIFVKDNTGAKPNSNIKPKKPTMIKIVKIA
jgi:hypothetical protein